MTLLQSVGGWIAVRSLRHPYLIRAGIAVARDLGPNVKLGNAIVVTRAEDILEVLGRTEDFLTESEMGPKMLWGSFVLGQDPSPRYWREREVLVEALGLVQPALMETVKAECAALLADANGEFDLARDFVSRIPLRIEQRQFGVPMDGAQTRTATFGQEQGEMAVEFWLRTLGSIIAQGTPAPFSMQSRGERAARELRQWVKKALDEQRAEARKGEPSTVLQYLVQNLDDDDAQERNLAGLMVVNYGIIVRAFCLSIDRLLDEEGAIDRLNELARAGDRDGLHAMWNEALRFNPAIPVVSRSAARDTKIAAGTPREVQVSAGDTVALPLTAAMMDPEAVERPSEFTPGRPAEVYHHFGAGIHRCLGRFIAEPELTEIYLQVFSRVRLHRIPGPRGRVVFDDLGPAVRQFRVRVERL